MNILFAACILAASANNPPPQPNPSNIRVLPMSRIPESNTVKLAIAVPQDGQYLTNPVWIQFRIDGYALGAGSQFDRSKEVVVSDMGQTVHVIIDDNPYFAINEPALDPFDEGGFYYDMSYKFAVPYNLKKGMHTIRMFPCRSFGESLKGDKVFQAMTFYIGDDRTHLNVDLSQPYITYNEPSNEMYLVEEKPVLLDFFVSNTELSPDGYKVLLSIDGKTNRKITFWQPYYIYGLKKGDHTIRLELLDGNDQLVGGAFNKVQQTITIH